MSGAATLSCPLQRGEQLRHQLSHFVTTPFAIANRRIAGAAGILDLHAYPRFSDRHCMRNSVFAFSSFPPSPRDNPILANPRSSRRFQELSIVFHNRRARRRTPEQQSAPSIVGRNPFIYP